MREKRLASAARFDFWQVTVESFLDFVLGNQGLHPLTHAELSDANISESDEDAGAIEMPSPKRPKTRSQTDKSAQKSAKKSASQQSRGRTTRNSNKK